MRLLVEEAILKQSVLKANKDFDNVENITIDGTIVAGDWYLIASGTTIDNYSIKLAIKLKTADKTNNFVMNQKAWGNTCKGHCCSSCKFTKRGSEIVGCECGVETGTSSCTDIETGTSNARSDHTVSESPGLASIE